MLYRKIRAEFVDEKDRLYRVMYVRKDIKLHELACVIINSFGGTYEHSFYYYYRKRGTPQYVSMVFFDNRFFEQIYMNDVTLSDEHNNIILEYDTGAGWDFRIKLYKTEIELDDERFAIIKEAVGQGIWEDNIHSLHMYLNGEVSKEDTGEEDAYPSLPWNFDNTCFGDFDKEVDLKELQDAIDDVTYDILNYLEEQLEYYKGCTEYLDIEERDEIIKKLEKEIEDFEDKSFAESTYSLIRDLINNFDFIKKEYERLSLVHGDDEASEMIAEEYFKIALDEKDVEKKINDGRLEKALKELK